MTHTELADLIRSAKWFDSLGDISHGERSYDTAIECSDWDWLPTMRDQLDPISFNLPCVDRRCELDAAKAVLTSLRAVSDDDRRLVAGATNMMPAAKGGAQYAAVHAAREISHNAIGLWCKCMRYYSNGWWPLGIGDDGSLIVF